MRKKLTISFRSLFRFLFERTAEIYFHYFDYKKLMKQKVSFEIAIESEKEAYKGITTKILESFKDFDPKKLDEYGKSVDDYVKTGDLIEKIVMDRYNNLRRWNEIAKGEFVEYSIKRELYSFIVALIFGMLLNLIGIISILDIMVNEGVLDISYELVFSEEFLIPRLIDLCLTGLIFAGGPSLIHQIIALIQKYKDKAKGEK